MKQGYDDNLLLRLLGVAGQSSRILRMGCFAARRGAGIRPQFSCCFVDSPLAGRPFFFGTLLLTTVIFAQAVRLRYVLRDLLSTPLPKLSVKSPDRFEVHRQFPSIFSFKPGPKEVDYALVHFGKQAGSSLRKNNLERAKRRIGTPAKISRDSALHCPSLVCHAGLSPLRLLSRPQIHRHPAIPCADVLTTSSCCPSDRLRIVPKEITSILPAAPDS